MQKCDKAVEVFETRAKKIIGKYAVQAKQPAGCCSYSRLFGFFCNFNLGLVQVDEELHRESWNIVMRYRNHDQVDILHLFEKLSEKRALARLEFIRYQSTTQC